MRPWTPILLIMLMWVGWAGVVKAQPAGAEPPSLTRAAVQGWIEAPQWRLLAVEYARSPSVAERRLVVGAEPGARVDMSWYFFVALGRGRVILIDCGTDAFARSNSEGRRRSWGVVRAQRVAEALRALTTLQVEQVTDVVLTHHHWDHVGGLGSFPQARVHVHPGEWARVPERLRRPVEREQRLHLLGRDDGGLWEGFEVREGGLHTRHHHMVQIACADRPMVIASDAAYLYRNIEEGRAVAVSAHRRRNVEQVAREVQRVGRANVLPGHDPAIFERYRTNNPSLAFICR